MADQKSRKEDAAIILAEQIVKDWGVVKLVFERSGGAVYLQAFERIRRAKEAFENDDD